MTTLVSNAYTTVDGNFYYGMTLEDAKKTNANIKLFNQIDELDGILEGKLSEQDIRLFEEAEERNKQKSNIKTGVALTLDAIAIGSALTFNPLGLIVATVSCIGSFCLKLM